MRGRVGILAAFLLFGGGVWASAAAAAAPKDTVTVGAALSLTGSLSREGGLTREGEDQAGK